MYPNEELEQLARRKVIVRGSISVNRWRCRQAATRVSKPLGLVDQALGYWRKLSPFLKIGILPAGLLFKRLVTPRAKSVGIIGSLVKWLPAALGAFRAFKGMRTSR